MDFTPDQPISDNEELAKVLASVGSDDDSHKPKKSAIEEAGLQFEETPAPGQPQDPPEQPAISMPEPGAGMPTTSSPAPAPEPTMPAGMSYEPPAKPKASSELDDLKKAALEELRPLVTKLELPPEEKFDTLLLVIRSTDDKSLLEPAHEAAKLITNESKRAQALLDIIKEIDYFGSQGK